MPNADSLAAIAQGSLIANVDDNRGLGDEFKLQPGLRAIFDTNLAALEEADDNTVLTESDRAGGSAAARAAIDRLKELVHDGYNGIKGIPSTDIDAAQRLQTFTAYGWSGGKVGVFRDARTIGLARLGVEAHPAVPAAFRYQAAVVTAMTAQLAIFDANVDNKELGNREVATHDRDNALEKFQTTLARIRFFYCSASDDIDQTPQLATIGFQPRRDAGTVFHPKAPTPPGP